ncbi:MAG: COP23 domain-containing protein [Waterburya sp.]
MINLSSLMAGVTTPLIALISLALFVKEGQTANVVNVTCDQQAAVPTVIATLSNHEISQVTPILSFLPQYFSASEALMECNNTAEKLNTFYNQGKMNYLASDTINEKPVVCAVERRGLGCDSYNSSILFSLSKPVSPTELLFNMLGSNFKGSQLPSSRTVSRIYTDLRPFWWPFSDR